MKCTCLFRALSPAAVSLQVSAGKSAAILFSVTGVEVEVVFFIWSFPLVLEYAQLISKVNVDRPWCILYKGSSTARSIIGFKKHVSWLSNSDKHDILATLTGTE